MGRGKGRGRKGPEEGSSQMYIPRQTIDQVRDSHGRPFEATTMTVGGGSGRGSQRVGTGKVHGKVNGLLPLWFKRPRGISSPNHVIGSYMINKNPSGFVKQKTKWIQRGRWGVGQYNIDQRETAG